MVNAISKAALLGAAAASATVGFAAPAGAQATSVAQTTPEAPGESGAQLSDIVVTAQKREETSQRVPIALSVVTGQQLERSGVSNLDGVSKITPGFQFGGYSQTRPQLYIRGIGSVQIDPGVDQSVGVFLDDVYIPRVNAIETGLFDVSRIEVLKGPQGTLYGRNTIAGAINITTARPTNVLEGKVEAGYGSFDAWEVKGTVSGPIVPDRVLARLTASYIANDGYSLNTLSGRRGNGDGTLDLSAKLLLKPSDRFEAYIIAAYNRGRLPGEINKSSGDRPLQSLEDPAGPSISPSRDPFSDAYNVDPYTRRSVTRTSAKLVWTGDTVQLTSVSSYLRSTLDEFRDADATRLDIWTQRSVETSRTFAEELRLTSQPDGPLTFGNRVQWLVGAYAFDERVRRGEILNFGRDSIFYAGLVGVLPFDPIPLVDDYRLAIHSQSVAAFVQASGNITDKLKLTVGARYSYDHKVADIAQISSPTFEFVIPSFVVSNDRASWSSFDPKGTLSYQFTRDINVYASIGTGFKSGGFQDQVTSAALAARPFNPERVTTYEGGIKSELFGRRLRVNVSGYFNDYRNLQVPQIFNDPDTGVPTVLNANAASSHIYGGELETQYVLSKAVRLSLGYAYTHARYQRYIIQLIGRDYSGSSLIRAPEHVVNGAIDVDRSIGSLGSVGLHLDATYSSSYFLDARSRPGPTAYPGSRQDAFALVNARAEYRLPRGGWAVAASVRNLTDHAYRAASLNLGDGGADLVTYAAPRTWLVTVSKDF